VKLFATSHPDHLLGHPYLRPFGFLVGVTMEASSALGKVLARRICSLALRSLEDLPESLLSSQSSCAATSPAEFVDS
jgi:hypothetical protein